MEVGGWVQVSLGIFCSENRAKIALNQYWCFGVVYSKCILCVYTLLKVVGNYDLSDGFPKKKVWTRGVGGLVEIYPFFWVFLECF